MSKIVPFCVHTGCVYGCSDNEQKLNGSRRNGTSPPFLACDTPAPALAEYASPDAHSECVI